MAVIIPMPTNVPEAVSTGYQRQNEISRMMMSGHLRIGFSNMDNSEAPKVLAYSVFEMDDALYRTLADEAVGGSVSAGYNYVYAVPNDGGAAFRYSAAKPSWDVMKAGWYNGANRAVLEINYAGGIYGSKRIMDIYNYKSRFEVNTNVPIPDTGGALVFQAGKVNQEEDYWLLPGAYRIELKGGWGGDGGKGGTGGPDNYISLGGSGGAGVKDSQAIVYKVYVTDQKNVKVTLGGDGGNGGDGGAGRPAVQDGGGGGGGGGASGGSSIVRFVSDDVRLSAMGGSGGGGGGGGGGLISSGGGGGGGGGNGYGSGGSGDSGENYSYVNNGGAGGSGGGSLGGGAGGSGGAGNTSENNGGSGSGSRNSEGGSGGAGGGGTYGGAGGAGGVPLSTTHGYVRIYRTQ